MFDQYSLLQLLQSLPFSKEEYWVVAGGAMVLHGFRPQTRDVDLGCTALLADQLEQQIGALLEQDRVVEQLIKDPEDPSPFPALTQLEAWGTEVM